MKRDTRRLSVVSHMLCWRRLTQSDHMYHLGWLDTINVVFNAYADRDGFVPASKRQLCNLVVGMVQVLNTTQDSTKWNICIANNDAMDMHDGKKVGWRRKLPSMNQVQFVTEFNISLSKHKNIVEMIIESTPDVVGALVRFRICLSVIYLIICHNLHSKAHLYVLAWAVKPLIAMAISCMIRWHIMRR